MLYSDPNILSFFLSFSGGSIMLFKLSQKDLLRQILSVSLLLLLLFSPSTSSLAQSASDQRAAQSLEVGKPIERELKERESHLYQITLTAGQFLHLQVEQQGIDVAILLSGNNERLEE